jgi:hypothetical protein
MKSPDASQILLQLSTDTQLELEKVLSVLSMYENNYEDTSLLKMQPISSIGFRKRGTTTKNIKKLSCLLLTIQLGWQILTD